MATEDSLAGVEAFPLNSACTRCPLVAFPATPAQFTQPQEGLDLVEIGIGLWRRRWLAFLVFIVIVAIGVGLAIHHESTYRYTAIIRPGSYVTAKGVQHPIGNLTMDLAAMKSAYLPNAIRHYLTAHKNAKPNDFKLAAEAATGTNVIVLSGKTSKRLGQAYLSIERNAASALVRGKAHAIELVRANLRRLLGNAKARLQALEDPIVAKSDLIAKERVLATAQSALATLKNDASVLKTRLHNEQSLKKLYFAREQNLDRYIQRTRKTMRLASFKNKGTNSAMTTLLLGASMERNAAQLQTVQHELVAQIPDGIASLNQQLATNTSLQISATERVDQARDNFKDMQAVRQRNIQKEKLAVNQLKEELNSITGTRFLSPPRRSEGPVGGSGIIVAASFILGIVAAFFAAAMAAYLSAAKAQFRNRVSSSAAALSST